MLFFQPVEHTEIKQFPLFSDPVPCGSPPPAQDCVKKRINLNNLSVQHPSTTYFVRSSDDSMMGAGVGADDLLAVNSIRKTVHGGTVIAAVEDELTVKRLQLYSVVMSKPGNSTYTPIMIGNEDTLDMFGVVTSIIKSAG